MPRVYCEDNRRAWSCREKRSKVREEREREESCSVLLCENSQHVPRTPPRVLSSWISRNPFAHWRIHHRTVAKFTRARLRVSTLGTGLEYCDFKCIIKLITTHINFLQYSQKLISYYSIDSHIFSLTCYYIYISFSLYYYFINYFLLRTFLQIL